MLYAPVISPYNLLENAKLENYRYVKYYTNEIGLIAEMQCEIPGEGEKVFYYQFDKKDYLQMIYQGGWKETTLYFQEKKQQRQLQKSIMHINQCLIMHVSLENAFRIVFRDAFFNKVLKN